MRGEADQAERASAAAASAAADAAAKAARARADEEAIQERQRELKKAAAAVAQQEAAATKLAEARRVAKEAAELAARLAMARTTVRQIFESIAPHSTKFHDASGSALPPYLLDHKFLKSYEESSTLERRRMLMAASALMHAVLQRLAPLPLATAGRLVDPPKRSGVQVASDPMRSALMGGTVSSKRRFLTQLASCGVVQSLVASFVAAEARKATAAEKAQILAPLTASYTLRLFNEIFRISPMSQLTRYVWYYGQWHERVFLSGQTPMQSVTQRWRLRGRGPGGTAPHAAIVEAGDFLTSDETMQHTAYGSRRVRMSDGTWVVFPATERKRCVEALWRLYATSFGDDGNLTAEESSAATPDHIGGDDAGMRPLLAVVHPLLTVVHPPPHGGSPPSSQWFTPSSTCSRRTTRAGS